MLHDESVPALENVVSLFEPHTDIIIKERREVQHGDKLTLTNGASGLLPDVVFEDGNPADQRVFDTHVETPHARYGHPPRGLAIDGGYVNAANVASLRFKPVADLAK